MNDQKPMKPSRKRLRPYGKSGFHGAKKALSKGGLSALDGRSREARALKVWKAQVVDDLGGLDALSAAELTLLDAAAVDMALLAVADSYLRELGTAVLNKRRKTFVPLVRERLAVASHLQGLLRDLGLRRKVRDLPSLGDYLGKKAEPVEPQEGQEDAC